jgi:hypothetical protein
LVEEKLRRPLCPTCAHNVIVRSIVAGKRQESRGCARHIRCFPECTACRDFEREPGTDDGSQALPAVP